MRIERLYLLALISAALLVVPSVILAAKITSWRLLLCSASLGLTACFLVFLLHNRESHCQPMAFATQAQDGTGSVHRLRFLAERRLRCFSAHELRTSSSSISRAAAALRADGAVTVCGVLSRGLAGRLASLVDETALFTGGANPVGLQRACDDPTLVESFEPDADANRDGEADGLRVQRGLPLSALVREALSCALTPLAPVLRAGLGPRAALWELGCIVAHPGAPHQNMHRDNGHIASDEPFVYNVFIALQDVTCMMGPTVVLARTHSTASLKADTTLYAAQESATNAAERARDDPCMATLNAAEQAVKEYFEYNRAPLLRCGDALVYDTRVRHCGSANVSTQPRRILTFAFAAERAAEADEAAEEETAERRLDSVLRGVTCSLDDDPAHWPDRPDGLVRRDTYTCQ